MRFRFRLSHNWQRRIEHYRAQLLWALGYPVHLVTTLFREAGGLLVRWWHQRNLKFLLQGLPSLFLLIGAVTFGVVVYFQDRNLLASQYKIQAERSLVDSYTLLKSNKDAAAPLALSQTCYERLVGWQPEVFEHLHGLATIFELQKKYQESDDILRRIAPMDRTGYGPAHLALARRLLNSKVITREIADQAEQHLIRASKWRVGGPVVTEAHRQLAILYKERNQMKEAEEHLQAAAQARPELTFDLAFWSLGQNNTTQARNYASRAIEYFRKRLDNSLDDHEARAKLVECYLLMRDFDAAKKYALDGFKFTIANKDLHAGYYQLLLKTVLSEYDYRTDEDKLPVAERYALLEQGLTYFPQSLDLLQRLVTFMNLPGEEGQKARKVFLDMITKGQPSPVAYLVLGIAAWRKDDPGEAKRYWEMALDLYKGEPQATAGPLLAANNLAWVLAHFEPVDYDRALSLIDQVLAKSQNQERFHSTKGHILFKMGRYKEALPELEIAKRVYPDDANLFTVLKETCEKLGYQMQAEAYQKRLEEIKARTASRSPAARDKQPAEGTKDQTTIQPRDASPTPPVSPDAKSAPAKTPAPPGGPQRP